MSVIPKILAIFDPKIFPTAKDSDLETLDKIITDRELEDLERDHGYSD